MIFKWSSIIITSCFVLNVQAQTMTEQLWKAVNKCNQEIKSSFDEDEINDPNDVYERLDVQPKNGYLSVAGSWPTCGCGCDATAAAYRDSEGKYTVLSYEFWTCSDKYAVNASKPLEKVLPKDFGLATFTSTNRLDVSLSNAFFYLSIAIPKKGTDTRVDLKLMPLGMRAKAPKGICYDTEKAVRHHYDVYDINLLFAMQHYIHHLDNEADFKALLNKDYSLLPDNLTRMIQESKPGRTQANIHQLLRFLQDYYDAYQQVDYTRLILAWDRRAARFVVKNKENPTKQLSFFEFLKEYEWYTPKC